MRSCSFQRRSAVDECDLRWLERKQIARRNRVRASTPSDARRHSRHGVSVALYSAWLLVIGMVGTASAHGVSRSSAMRRWRTDSRRSPAPAALEEPSRRPHDKRTLVVALPVVVPAQGDAVVEVAL